MTSIGSYAFYDCTNLTSVTIPNEVTPLSMPAASTSLVTITRIKGAASLDGPWGPVDVTKVVEAECKFFKAEVVLP